MRKRWRYLGIFTDELMFCVGQAQVGIANQNWWAVLDRSDGQLTEQTSFGRGKVTLDGLSATVSSKELQLDIKLIPETAMEVTTPVGDGYTWTRKTLAQASGTLVLNGKDHLVSSQALIDDSAGYHSRHTTWQWSAGFGHLTNGEPVAWNLVNGINDSDQMSERSVWLGKECRELEPVEFEEDLSALTFKSGDRLDFASEAERSRNENLLLVRSKYRQPFGTFTGSIPEVGTLLDGFGVMESHDVYW